MFTINQKVIIPSWFALCFKTILVTAFLIFIGCSDDDDQDDAEFSLQGTNLSVDDISGDWTATMLIFEFLDLPVDPLDLIAEGGGATMNIQNNGNFTFTLIVPDEPVQIFTGRLGFDETALVLEVDEEYLYFSIELVEGILSINGPVEIDLDLDGVDEATFMSLEMVSS